MFEMDWIKSEWKKYVEERYGWDMEAMWGCGTMSINPEKRTRRSC